MRLLLKLLISLFLLTLLPAPGNAQQQAPLIDFDAQMEAARKLMSTERRLVHATELELTREESKAFWPIYMEYTADIRAVGDRKVSLIAEYGKNFDSITDEFAERALKESFDIDSEFLKIQKKYLKDFKRALPITKVVRFYQIESKLDAVVNFQLASQIPLMEIGSSPQ
jgi:hypothetical protein